MMRRLVSGLLAALAFSAPAQAALPPYTGAYEPQGVDERGLWMMMDEEERKLRDSGFVVRDPALNAYVRGVLCKTVGAERCGAVRLYIMRVPAFNASMAPNGMMQVWTGLLLRIHNESELAGILGHEYGHFEMRHSLAGFRHARSMTDIASWMGFAGYSGLVVGQAAIGSIFAFDRGQEQAADQAGFTFAQAAPYRTAAIPELWDRLMGETDASRAARGQRSTRYDGNAFFSTHPTDLQRATTLRALAAKEAGGTDDGGAAYRAAMAPWMAGFLADQIKRNDFGGTEYLLGELAKDGWTPELLFARAELFRLRGNPRDLATAAGFYRDCIAKGSTDAEARRGLGFALLRGQSPDEGKQALRDYLAMKPDAQDAAMIRMMIGQ